MPYKQFDPKKVAVSIGGVPCRAFADGTMITVETIVDKRSLHVGSDGQGRHIKTADESCLVTLRLASYSPTNAALIALDQADEPFPIAITDASSSADLFFSDSSTVRKIPNMVKGTEENPLEWIFQCVKGQIIHSGAEA